MGTTATTTYGIDDADVLFQKDFAPEVFRQRRAKVMAAMESGSLAIIPGAEKNSTHDVFRQSNDFYYLCGIETPHAYLLLDAKNGSSAVYLPHLGQDQRDREGEILCAERAEDCVRLSGIDEALGVELLIRRLEGCTRVYTPFRQNEGTCQSWDTLQRSRQDIYSDPWDGRPDRTDHFLGLLRARCPKAEIRDLGPALDRLRLFKEPGEVELLRRAGTLSALGLVEAMRCTRPGMKEYQLDAAMRYVYHANGARDSSYRSIVAGGPNSWYGHYEANTDILKYGDLVLVDAGPEYRYYTSDATRIWPVNGTYTPIQRELYGFIVEYHQTLLTLIRAGISDVQLLGEAREIMTKVVERTHFSKDIYESAARRALVFPHLTHSVGMAVHDVGSYKGGGIIPAGVVFALDPQLIIPEERLYIRVEDTVLVTEEGVENLSAPAPLDLDGVERVMKEEGMCQRYPAIF